MRIANPPARRISPSAPPPPQPGGTLLRKRPARRDLLGLVGLVLALALAGPWAAAMRLPATVAADAPSLLPDDQSEELFTLINCERARAGLQVLQRVSEVDQVAAARAIEMAAAGSLYHFDSAGSRAEELLDQWGVAHQMVGENIGRTTSPVEQAAGVLHAAFMASMSHQANELGPEFGRVGIALATVDGTSYAAIVFVD